MKVTKSKLRQIIREELHKEDLLDKIKGVFGKIKRAFGRGSEEEDEDAALKREVEEMQKEVEALVKAAKKLNQDAGAIGGIVPDQFKKTGGK